MPIVQRLAFSLAPRALAAPRPVPWIPAPRVFVRTPDTEDEGDLAAVLVQMDGTPLRTSSPSNLLARDSSGGLARSQVRKSAYEPKGMCSRRVIVSIFTVFYPFNTAA